MDYVAYRVKSGDTLSKIAATYKTTVAAIVRVNGIADANKVAIGQQLNIPVKSATAAPADSDMLEEVVVTARKPATAATLQDNPWLKPPRVYVLAAAVALVVLAVSADD